MTKLLNTSIIKVKEIVMKVLNANPNPALFQNDLADFYQMCVSHRYAVDVKQVLAEKKVGGKVQKSKKLWMVEAPDDHDAITRVFFTEDGYYYSLTFVEKSAVPKYNN